MSLPAWFPRVFVLLTGVTLFISDARAQHRIAQAGAESSPVAQSAIAQSDGAPSFATQNLAPQISAAAHKVALAKLLDTTSKLSPETKRHLSHALQNYLRFADAAVNGKALAPSADFAHKKPWQNGFSATGSAIQVSDPALDPASKGYTQNTTSSAWCGNTIVVGYEDSGAYYRTDPNAAFGVPISYDGISISSDAGKSFKDSGFLSPGTFSANALLGDPVVTCTSATHFQYASILNTTTPDGLDPLIGPSISFSTNGGKTWTHPLQIVSLDGNTQLADNPWLAVDPTNTQRLFLSYTEIDALACNRIEVVTSTNGGTKWSAPVIIDQACPPTSGNAAQATVAGSSITVGRDGKVYLAYEFFPGAQFNVKQINAIKFASSTNHGTTFSKPSKIADLVPSGTGAALDDGLLVDEYPHIAVDRSNGPSRGTIYVVYPDGRNKIRPDGYAYPDIFVAKSTTSGRTFSVLGAISRTPKTFRGVGRDQFLPGVSVDQDGEVAVCYYDRRNDSANLRVDRFCSVSINQGKTWTDQQASNMHWMPSQNADPLSPTAGYAISEYDALTSEFLLHGDGFFGAFIVEIGGNQNVVATKF